MHRSAPSSPRCFEQLVLQCLESPALHQLVIAAIVLTYLATLWQFDLRAWDEGLDARRVLGILTSGQWLDRTAAAEGGLWSRSHPPLMI